jgi:hypothetical protein
MQMPSPVGNSLSVAVAAFFVLAAAVWVVAAAVWVHSDAKMYARRGNPVVFSWGALHLSTPMAWFFACLLLGELFVPAYIDSRSLA